MDFPGFPRDFVRFLKELAANNDSAWFDAHRARFAASVQQPMLEFVAAMAPRIRRISSHLLVEPRNAGGSVLRIRRDTRFSPDKNPYHTNMTAVFRHECYRDAPAPGLWFRIDTRGVHLGAGLRRPDAASATRVRAAIDRNPAAWKRARDHGSFRACFGALGGESLRRPPKGFAADHPLLDDLRRKEFVALKAGRHALLASEAVLDEVDAAFGAARPLLRFLCDALELEF